MNLPGLGDAECGGRFVEQNHFGIPQHRFGDRHGLALAAGKAGHRLPHRGHGAHRQRLQCVPRHRLHAGLVEHPAVLELAAEEHVLDDVEVVAQREVLVDDLHAQRRHIVGAMHGHRSALEQVGAGIDGMDAGDRLHQRRLACAVVAYQSGHLTGINPEVDVVEHMHNAETLVHTL